MQLCSEGDISDGCSEHSIHHTDTEQSAESDNGETFVAVPTSTVSRIKSSGDKINLDPVFIGK